MSRPTAVISVRRAGKYSDEDALIISTDRADTADAANSYRLVSEALDAAEIMPALSRPGHVKITFDPRMGDDQIVDLLTGLLESVGLSVTHDK